MGHQLILWGNMDKEIDDLIEPPADGTSIDKADSRFSLAWVFFSLFLGFLGSSILTFDFILALLLYAAALIGPFAIRKRKKSSAIKLEQLMASHIAAERERLTKLKSSMSVAEWENYKLQLINSRLLKTIASKPGGKNVSRSSSHTIIQEIAEE